MKNLNYSGLKKVAWAYLGTRIAITVLGWIFLITLIINYLSLVASLNLENPDYVINSSDVALRVFFVYIAGYVILTLLLIGLGIANFALTLVLWSKLSYYPRGMFDTAKTLVILSLFFFPLILGSVALHKINSAIRDEVSSESDEEDLITKAREMKNNK
ncbi:hypothetical protein ACA758_00420 [Mycoplasmopsis agassizii]|uniref:Uncharacterized protein n=1 Tax=Mycoplasmopsis agassizii TaxID=33922 RepID=A0ABX4H4G7_9BACT|nr:hypothetical protein [Mycoplasmopsis agassizii]PAF54779.1 hypothetical protein CJF60_03515 [Mycoplasmopsis agassizii]SMC19635.1 hypothetical protein SAMN02745179_00933 [Mycoplasmopsis agassizii]